MSRNRSFVIVTMVLGILFLLGILLAGLQFINSSTNSSSVVMKRLATFAAQTAEAMNAEFSTLDPNSMKSVEIFGTQTAMVALIPTATLLATQKYWSPPTGVDFSPHFIYDSIHWARTDVRTLASLQVSGCTLRVAGGHALGPGWTTEEASWQVGHLTFTTILAMDETSPQFITYSLNNGTVFEISSTADFKQCQQDGEAVLKTIMVE